MTVTEQFYAGDDAFRKFKIIKSGIPFKAQLVRGFSESLKMKITVSGAGFNQGKISLQESCLGYGFVPFIPGG